MENIILKIRNLKEIDKKILLHLIEDSHQSYREIAEKLSTTRQNISQRIKKLQEKQIILNYTINFNIHLFEEFRVKAYILFREVPNSKTRKHDENILKNITEITNVSRLFGKYDGIIEVIARDNEQVSNIIKTIHELNGIKETETFIVHTRIKDDKMIPILKLLA